MPYPSTAARTDRLTECMSDNLHRPCAVTGRKGFVVGCMDGSFPDLGHHIPGEMGGVWMPPVKIADGYWFGVRRSGADDWHWLCGATARRFERRAGAAVCEHVLQLDEGGSVQVVQTCTVAANEPAVFLGLDLANGGDDTADLEVAWLVRFEIRGAWWSDWPDGPDAVTFDHSRGAMLARDLSMPEWGAVALGDLVPALCESGEDLWGPEHTGCLRGEDDRPEGILRNPDVLRGAGCSGLLGYRVLLPAHGQRTMHFVLAGGKQLASRAVVWGEGLLADRERQEQDARRSAAAALDAAPSVSIPEARFDRIFDGSVACLDLLTQEIPGVGRGVVAGLPGFAWFFGCDTYYSVPGLLVANQVSTAMSTSRVLAGHARLQGGRIPHEVVQSGELFNPGNAVETAEFAISIERIHRWSGDHAFLAEMYPLVKQGLLSHLLGECDPEQTLLPRGAGLLELSTASDGRKLDVASALFQGLGSLAYLADAVGESKTARQAQDLARRVRGRIRSAFWDAAQGDYVWRIGDDLSLAPGEPTHGFVALEFGVETSPERVARVFAAAEGARHTGDRGLIVPGSHDFVMPIQNAILALAEFRYNRPDEGLRYLRFCAAEYAHYMPWAIPEFIGEDSCVVQAWSSATFVWLAVQGFLRLSPDPASGVVRVHPQLPAVWNHLEVRGLTVWGIRHDLSLRRDVHGRVRFSARTSSGEPPAFRFEVVENAPVPVSFV